MASILEAGSQNQGIGQRDKVAYQGNRLFGGENPSRGAFHGLQLTGIHLAQLTYRYP